MSIGYSILESRHRWLILAGIAMLLCILGTIMVLALEWSHVAALIWLYSGLAATLIFLVLAFLDWRARVEDALADD